MLALNRRLSKSIPISSPIWCAVRIENRETGRQSIAPRSDRSNVSVCP